MSIPFFSPCRPGRASPPCIGFTFTARQSGELRFLWQGDRNVRQEGSRSIGMGWN